MSVEEEDSLSSVDEVMLTVAKDKHEDLLTVGKDNLSSKDEDMLESEKDKILAMDIYNGLQLELARTQNSKQTKHKNTTCEICGRLFPSPSHLKNHLLIHSDEKPYSCGTCGKSFKRNGDLKKHMLIHTGEKTHCCFICEKLFREAGTFVSMLLACLSVILT